LKSSIFNANSHLRTMIESYAKPDILFNIKA